MVDAKVVCHSITGFGSELITFEIDFHRFILPELNTHRVFSRNYQSSRAVPISKMIQQVLDNPAIPVHWGENQRGMVAEKTLPSFKSLECLKVWTESALKAVEFAKDMDELGCHKQVVNRLLEPFMYTKGVITGTKESFEGFFKLRVHKDAQPEIKLLAEIMKEKLLNSVPRYLGEGGFHLPYLDLDEYDPTMSLEDAIKISTSCCAQVSYRSLDTSREKALKIYDMLNLPVNGVYKGDMPHYSPSEHIARVVEDTQMDLDIFKSISGYSGNFNNSSFFQYRKALEHGLEEGFIYE